MFEVLLQPHLDLLLICFAKNKALLQFQPAHRMTVDESVWEINSVLHYRVTPISVSFTFVCHNNVQSGGHVVWDH